MELSIENVKKQLRRAIDSLHKTDFCFAKEIVVEGLIGITLDRFVNTVDF